MATKSLLFVGAGAVGSYIGAFLSRAGHDVTYIASGAHLAAIRERGLTVRSPMLGTSPSRRARRKTRPRSVSAPSGWRGVRSPSACITELWEGRVQ